MIGVDNYVQYGSVKSSWVTLYILFIIWGVLYMLKPFYEGDDASDLEYNDKKSTTLLSRLGNSYNVIKENAMLQLFALTFNGFGTGSTKALSVLSWIYFILTIIYALGVIFINHKILRSVFHLAFFVLILIMSTLALKHGW
ncbi:hypothetical protein K501DRAFT_190615 [Backusella circina FSU 941]|nr:hypothetical protein K501DRAFT_190615 [Backusella circina FSU 941]